MAMSTVQGVAYWPLPESLWDYEDEPYHDWTNDHEQFDTLNFDPKFDMELAKTVGIDGLGPCLMKKHDTSEYILRDREGHWYWWCEDINLLMTWPRDGMWPDDVIIQIIVGNGINVDEMVEWQDIDKHLEEWRKQRIANEVEFQKYDELMAQVEKKRAVAEKAINLQIQTTGLSDLTPRTPQPSSPLKRKDSPVKLAESPSKRVHEWDKDIVESSIPSDMSDYGRRRKLGGSDESGATDDTDDSFIADMENALEDISE